LPIPIIAADGPQAALPGMLAGGNRPHHPRRTNG